MKTFLTTTVLLFAIIANAQQPNPWASIGKTENRKFLTLSDGEYDEFHENQRYVKVGSAIVDVQTNKISHFVKENNDTTEYGNEADVIHRWLSPDPHEKKYPGLSPYVAFANSPIYIIDQNGTDSLVMHRSGPVAEMSKGNSKIYKITFSMVENGVERQLPNTMYMLGNSDYMQGDQKANSLEQKDAYTFIYKYNSQFENSEQEKKDVILNVKGMNVYIHPGNQVSEFHGCYGITQEEPEIYDDGQGGGYADIHNTTEALKTIKNEMYLPNESNITGEKFILKTNSGAKTDIIPMPMKEIKLSSTQNTEDPK